MNCLECGHALILHSYEIICLVIGHDVVTLKDASIRKGVNMKKITVKEALKLDEEERAGLSTVFSTMDTSAWTLKDWDKFYDADMKAWLKKYSKNGKLLIEKCWG